MWNGKENDVMEFAKYYNASNLVEEMQKAEEIDCYPTDNDKFEGVYVCMDTNDFWISRINKGYNCLLYTSFLRVIEILQTVLRQNGIRKQMNY